MPQAAAERLAAAVAEAVKEPEALERLASEAAVAIGSTPAQCAQFIAHDQKR